MTSKAYPTSQNVHVFINGIHIDEAHRVDFKEEQSKVPLYGYNDYLYSKVLYGRRLVQGFLAINFVYPGYLGAVLEREQLRLLEDHKNDVNDLKIVLPEADADRVTKAKILAEKLFDAEDTTTMRNLIIEATAKSVLDKDRTLYKQNTIPSHNVLNYNDSVDMTIYYSSPESAEWAVELEGVEFTSVSQTMAMAGDGSADPLFEVYEFIAKTRNIVVFGQKPKVEQKAPFKVTPKPNVKVKK